MLHYFFHGIPVLFAASQLETIGTSINYDQHRKISWKIPWKWLFKFISEKLRLHCIQISHKESHKKSDWIPWIPNDVRTTEGSGCESQKSKKMSFFDFTWGHFWTCSHWTPLCVLRWNQVKSFPFAILLLFVLLSVLLRCCPGKFRSQDPSPEASVFEGVVKGRLGKQYCDDGKKESKEETQGGDPRRRGRRRASHRPRPGIGTRSWRLCRIHHWQKKHQYKERHDFLGQTNKYSWKLKYIEVMFVNINCGSWSPILRQTKEVERGILERSLKLVWKIVAIWAELVLTAKNTFFHSWDIPTCNPT